MLAKFLFFCALSFPLGAAEAERCLEKTARLGFREESRRTVFRRIGGLDFPFLAGTTLFMPGQILGPGTLYQQSKPGEFLHGRPVAIAHGGKLEIGFLGDSVFGGLDLKTGKPAATLTLWNSTHTQKTEISQNAVTHGFLLPTPSGNALRSWGYITDANANGLAPNHDIVMVLLPGQTQVTAFQLRQVTEQELILENATSKLNLRRKDLSTSVVFLVRPTSEIPIDRQTSGRKLPTQVETPRLPDPSVILDWLGIRKKPRTLRTR